MLLLLPSNILEHRSFFRKEAPGSTKVGRIRALRGCRNNDTPAAVSDERLEFDNSTNRENHLIQGWGEVETNIEMEEVETKMMVVVG